MRENISQIIYLGQTLTQEITLFDILRWRSSHQPDQRAYTFLSDGEMEQANLTYAQLDQQSRSIAAMLQEYTSPGERALLVYQPGLDYISAFMGCLYAGIIAVPVYPPSSKRLLSRIQGIVTDAQPALVLTNTHTFSRVKRWFVGLPSTQDMHLIATDKDPEKHESCWKAPDITYDTLAFLQYTSGSTSTPKGVMVNHRNLMHNLVMQGACWQQSSASVGVSWLPMFHDLGLIAGVLQPLYMGFPAILMAPTAFIQHPVRWLKAISRFKGTTSWAPNFSYELCLDHITPAEREQLDLSSWSIALNGAEPIRMETMLRFAEVFKPCGMRLEAFTPAYGLAEGTLVVASSRMGQQPVFLHVDKARIEQHQVVPSQTTSAVTRSLVGCGSVADDQRVVIVHPETAIPCGQDEIGEIWVSGPSITAGYWHHPLETEQTFQATLKESGDTPFLRTGDLGFLHEKEIFITGRLKDVIILHGHNYYPQDIERTVEQSHPSLRPGSGAAFSLEIANTERLVVVQEVLRNYQHTDDTFAAIRQQVMEQHDVQVYAIILLRYGSIHKTSSGKIQRQACRKALLERTLSIVFADIPQPLADLLEQHGSEREHVPATIPQSSQVQSAVADSKLLPATPAKPAHMQFSLLYFSNNEAEFDEQKYTLFLEGAKFADQHDFMAIWISERHFHPFGDLYPNPSVFAAALATITQKIRLRAGSVVLPMHHPVRVAEEWSIVDNLSLGRVDLAFATGWNPNDFVLAPENYTMCKDILFTGLETIQKLWSGASISWPNRLGKETATKIYPLPRQQRLTPWITCTGNPERFVEAGSLGANILTGLLFQTIDELAEKIKLYRDALASHGYDPEQGHVTLMMHTFIGEDLEEVRKKVHQPFMAYLESSVDLWRHGMEKLETLSAQERENALSYAFERYFHTHALFGTPQTCQKMVEHLSAIGVNEIASLIDFGVDFPGVMENLNWLNVLRKRFQQEPFARREQSPQKEEISSTRNLLSTQERAFSEQHEEARIPKASGNEQAGQFSLHYLRDATPEERLRLLQGYLRQHIARVMERRTEEIAHVSALRSLGLDSLMVASIISHCRHDLEVPLDAGQFYMQTTFAELALYIARAIDHQREETKKRVAQAPALQLQRQPRQDVSPLSFAQQRLWFIHRMHPEAAAYNVPTAIQITGKLEIRALAWSLGEIIQRHEILRTTFTSSDEQPVQVISASSTFSLSVVKLALPNQQLREEQVHRLARQQAQLAFDLERGPMVRAMLLLLQPDEYVLLFTHHHIVADGWSRGVLIHELQALYVASLSGQPSPLADLPIQYADYTLWQRQRLQSPVVNQDSQPGQQEESEHSQHTAPVQTLLEQQLAYWKKQLGGPLPVIDFPISQPRPPIQTFRGAHLSIHLAEPLMHQLKELSKQEDVSLFMLLLASFQILLMRYSGQEDIVVGAPIAGRNRVEIEPLIGFFVNTLVLRTNLAGNPSFREVLQRVRKICLEAYAHQEVPFEKVVEVLQPERVLSHHPLFQVMFVLENDAWRFETPLGEARLHQITMESGLSAFDLTLIMTSSGWGEIEYNTDLFKADAIQRLQEHWQVLLEALVTHLPKSIATLPLLTITEQQQLLTRSSLSPATSLPDICIHQLFEEQARRTPEAIALTENNKWLSYSELDQRANQIAQTLRKQGIGPEVLVGVCMERSINLIVGILGILKAGGGYVPLDPGFPTERLNGILADARIQFLLTQSHLGQVLANQHVQIINLDTDWHTISQESVSCPVQLVHSDNLAYVIYTSGSTGAPKGVAIQHNNLLHLARWHCQAFKVTTSDRATLVAGQAFDASVWEIWPYLIAGASLHIPDEVIRTSPRELCDWLVAEEVTITFLPTPLAENILTLDWPAQATLRTMLTGGDVLHSFPGPQFPFLLVNNYGPTENTVVATSGITSVRDTPELTLLPSIGKPIDNVQIYFLDTHLQPVPDDIPGELCIAGTGLARGYLNRPDLTAEHFLPHPFSTLPGARLYKTGDKGHYLRNGEIEFLGRLDNQIKLRGFRIELEEIEAVLCQHPEVQETAVIFHTKTPGATSNQSQTQLVAYVVPVAEAFSESELRSYLRTKLPVYMIPACFLSLPSLPLNASGKVDRHLLAQQHIEQRPPLAVEEPQTEMEHLLVQIWQKTLATPSIGLHTNFFEMGGHSLHLAQVQSELQKALHKDISIIDLFSNPTIHSLALHLSQEQTQETPLFPDDERISRHHSSRQRQRVIRQQYAQEISNGNA